jgi:hypothetical protein
MAVRHGYGKIAGTDALVFAYDTGDTRNSYKGEPTVNLASNANFSNGTTGWNANQNVTLSVETINNIRFLKVKSNQTTSTPGFKSGNIAVSGNTTYTLTIRAYKNDNRSIWLYATGDGTGGSDIVWTPAPNGPNPITTELTTISRTFTTPSDMTYLQIGALWSAPLTTSEVYVEYMQLEQKSHATQFVNGTRSATQGLLDLTGNSSINLSNVSFDSNAQMTFDGTDDVITVSMDNLRPTSAITQEVLVYIDNNTTQVWIGSQYGTSSGNSYALWLNGANTLAAGVNISGGFNNQSQSYPITLNTYYHFVHTYDGTTQRIYANGIEIRQWATTGNIEYNTNNTLLAIGNDWNGSGYNVGASLATHGKQDITKIYNRALTAAEVQSNFKNYKKRFEGLDYYYDNTTDGGRWIRFWWYTGVGWPGHETAALGHPFGTFDSSNHYGFQRLPAGLTKSQVELLAKDGSGNVYKWDFANDSSTAQRVWDSMTAGTQGVFANGGAFNPTVIAGAFHGVQQDSWQYRVSEGVASFLLDDDTCDCVSTLNAGHAMCGGSGWNQQYAQPDGAYLRYGVDTLNDGGCLGPVPTRQLELYYRIKQ